MTRRDDLVRLRDAVRCGEWLYGANTAARSVFPWDERAASDLGLIAVEAFNGSLDAAMALHEALLHEATWAILSWSKRYEGESKAEITTNSGTWSETADSPARAWLGAILDALIAQEDAQDRGMGG